MGSGAAARRSRRAARRRARRAPESRWTAHGRRSRRREGPRGRRASAVSTSERSRQLPRSRRRTASTPRRGEASSDGWRSQQHVVERFPSRSCRRTRRNAWSAHQAAAQRLRVEAPLTVAFSGTDGQPAGSALARAARSRRRSRPPAQRLRRSRSARPGARPAGLVGARRRARATAACPEWFDAEVGRGAPAERDHLPLDLTPVDVLTVEPQLRSWPSSRGFERLVVLGLPDKRVRQRHPRAGELRGPPLVVLRDQIGADRARGGGDRVAPWQAPKARIASSGRGTRARSAPVRNRDVAPRSSTEAGRGPSPSSASSARDGGGPDALQCPTTSPAPESRQARLRRRPRRCRSDRAGAKAADVPRRGRQAARHAAPATARERRAAPCGFVRPS